MAIQCNYLEAISDSEVHSKSCVYENRNQFSFDCMDDLDFVDHLSQDDSDSDDATSDGSSSEISSDEEMIVASDSSLKLKEVIGSDLSLKVEQILTANTKILLLMSDWRKENDEVGCVC